MIDEIFLMLEFAIYLFLQALVINGIYISAKGEDRVLPDGRVVGSDMILYPLYRYLTQHTVVRIYFTYTELERRGHLKFYDEAMKGVVIFSSNEPFEVLPIGKQEDVNIRPLERWADAYLEAKVEYDKETGNFKLYQEEAVYRFSKYIRKPIIQCVVCMASFWSIWLFLVPCLIAYGFCWQIFPVWVVNVLALSFVNYLVFKPIR